MSSWRGADKFNAMDKEMFAAIGDTFRALGRDPAVRAILLSGQGKHFTAGLDLEYAAAQFRAERAMPAARRRRGFAISNGCRTASPRSSRRARR